MTTTQIRKQTTDAIGNTPAACDRKSRQRRPCAANGSTIANSQRERAIRCKPRPEPETTRRKRLNAAKARDRRPQRTRAQALERRYSRGRRPQTTSETAKTQVHRRSSIESPCGDTFLMANVRPPTFVEVVSH
jgi:hypothetical protein